MFCTHSSCYLCAVDIVEAGIKRFVFKNFYRSDEGIQHLIKAGVVVLLQLPGAFEQLTLEDFKPLKRKEGHESCGCSLL